MLRLVLFLLCVVFSFSSQAYKRDWGVKIEDEKLKIGGRLQGVIAEDSETGGQDLFLRRMRLNISYKPWDGHQFVYDIRNDAANRGDQGEEGFVIGDAFWKIDINKWSLNNIRLFRAKVDISYSQTSSSRHLFNPTRPSVAEHASDFIVQNRRANNLQANGNIQNLAYQVYLSDGVQSSDLIDLSGENFKALNYQKLSYGAKLRYFFLGDAKKNEAQDTFYGLYDTVSIGIGYGANDKINTTRTNDEEFNLRRSLTNIELSVSLGGFRLLAEQFSFDGDIIDSDAIDSNEVLGTSSGYYAQVEYVFGKWAPYISFENFDRNDSEDDYSLKTNTIGLNYYHNLDAMRFGIATSQTENEDNLAALTGIEDEQQTYLYAMINF